MTIRERIIAILDGKMPDRVPWIPRLEIWYEAHRRAGTLPKEYRCCTLREVERDVFGGTAARDGAIWRSELRNVEVHIHRHGQFETVNEYVTPVGTLSAEFRGTPESRNQGLADTQIGFLLKRREDYPVMEYIVENTHYTPTFEDYQRYEKEVGDEGYPLVRTGDCPFHGWMQGLVGYNQAFFHLQDFPEVVEHLLAVMTDHYRETIWRYMLDSPARLFQHGVHLSSHMTPPVLFDRYITPYYRELVPPLRAQGKVVALHADNDTHAILAQIEAAGFGMVECFVTSPMVATTLAEAREAWGPRVIIWGGVPSVLLEDSYSEEQFEHYMEAIFRDIAPGEAFILGIADNAMPGSSIQRIRQITQLVSQKGSLPICP